MHITLRQLEVFAEVHKSGSTTQASQMLALSQSAVSAALTDLEGQLGVQLFDRVGKRLVVNEHGRLLYPRALALLERALEIEQLFRGDNGAIRVYASSTIGNYIMPEIIARYRHDFPDLPVELSVGNSLDVINAVADLRVTFGGEWRHDKLKDPVNLSSGGQSTSASQYALFIEDEWRIIEPLALTTGIRMDDHQTYGDHWSPRAYLVYNATDTVTVKGGWATAFKAPSLLQLNPDWTTNSCRGSCSIIGNPDLKPETSESFELGLYYRGEEGWLQDVEGSITTFQNNVDDMIDVLRTSSASEAPGYPNFVGWKTVNGKRVPIFRYFNVNKARIKGVETEVKIPFGDEWKLTVNYTYNDGRDLSNGGDKPLQTLPFHTANGTLDWKPLDDWSFYVTANYTGQQRAVSATGKTPGGYTLFDVGAAWQVTKNVKLRSGVQNVGDKDLNRDDYSYTEEGRRYFMAVDYRF